MTIVGRLFWASFFDGVMKFLLALERVLKGRAGVAYGRPMVVFLEGVVGLVWVLCCAPPARAKMVFFVRF